MDFFGSLFGVDTSSGKVDLFATLPPEVIVRMFLALDFPSCAAVSGANKKYNLMNNTVWIWSERAIAVKRACASLILAELLPNDRQLECLLSAIGRSHVPCHDQRLSTTIVLLSCLISSVSHFDVLRDLA